MNPFEMLGLEIQYDIDDAIVEALYLKKIKEVHPDLFLSKIEKKEAMNLTLEINEAYRAVKDPIKRAKILMEIRGLKTDVKSSTVLLLEIMNIKEKKETNKNFEMAKKLFSKAFEENNCENMTLQYQYLLYLKD